MSQHSVKDKAFQALIKEEKAKCKAASGKCWLCHKRIDCDLPFTDKRSFTLDHVQDPKHRPDLSHTLSNLRWAHRSCNSKRGDGRRNKTNFTSRRW